MSDEEPIEPLLKMFPATRSALSERVDYLWLQIQTDEKPLDKEGGDRAYNERRLHYVEALGIAELVGHCDLKAIQTGCVEMQRTYAGIAQKKVLDGRQPVATTIRGIQDEIAELDKLQPERETLLAKAARDELDDDGYAHLRAISKKLKDRKTAPDRVKPLERQLELIDQVAGQFTQLLELPGAEVLDYRIPPPHEILEQLSLGTFKTLPFEPIGFGDREARSIFGGDVVTTQVAVGPLQLVTLAPTLQNLLFLKRTIDDYEPGSVFSSGKAAQHVIDHEGYDLNFPLGAKAVGSYLENAPDVFGVILRARTGGRVFMKREEYTPLEDATFLGRAVEYLNSQEVSAVNKFYLRSALTRLWDTNKAYDGFTAGDVLAAAQDGWSIPSRTVARAFTENPDEYDVEIIGNPTTRERLYRRKTMEVNDRQRAALSKALESLGAASFTDASLVSRVKALEKGYELSTVVARHFMETELGNGYKKISDEPLTYHSKKRPAAAAELAAAHQDDPNSVF